MNEVQHNNITVITESMYIAPREDVPKESVVRGKERLMGCLLIGQVRLPVESKL